MSRYQINKIRGTMGPLLLINKMLLISVIIAIIFPACKSQSSSAMPVPDVLEPMSCYHDKITLSGFSSGGTFAQQLQFAYSSLFLGIAVFSHTYYRCGRPNGLVDDYDAVCTRLYNLTGDQLYDPNLVHTDIKDYQSRGLIENTRNLRNKRLYVFTGLRNVLFSPRQSLSILSVYERYLGSLQTVFTRVQDANLVLPTDSRTFGAPCTEVSEPSFFIGQCGFSGVTEALNFLLFPHLNTTSEPFRRQNTQRGRLSTFDQREFTRDLTNHSMDDIGFYYVPRACQSYNNYNRRCYLHFYFHGCLSGREFAQTRHAENTGLLELADRKGIILIFPQASSSRPANEIGCWDTFGISGPLYATQKGPQITAVKRMIDRLLGRSRPPKVSPASVTSNPNWSNQGGASLNTNGGTTSTGNGNNHGNKQNPHRYSSHFNTKHRYGRQQY